MTKKIIINNLPFSLTEDRIGTLLVGCGEIVDIELIINPFTGRSRGCGYLEMQSPEAAQTAIEKLNGHELDGRSIEIMQYSDEAYSMLKKAC